MDRFCVKCGTELINGMCPKCAQRGSKNVVEYESRIKNFFISQNEQMVAVLGKAYSEEYIQKGKCSGGFAVVSDKRLYFFGKSYDICNNVFGQKGPRENKQSKSIDLRDVTGTGDSIYHQSRWLVMSILHLILWLICIIVGVVFSVPSLPESESQVMPWVFSRVFAPVIFIFMLIYLIIHITTKIHMFTIQYNGGEIAFYITDFPQQEITFFQRQLRLAKDILIANNSNREKNTINEAILSAVQSTPKSNKVDELAKLADLLSKGIITQEEFEKMKRELI